MKEFELSAPVEKWLVQQGMKVFAEVPCYDSNIDLVGYDQDFEGKIVAVELKLTLSKKVIHQAWLNTSFVDSSWCAIPTRPRKKNLLICKERGLGVLQILDNEIIILCPAVCKNPPLGSHRKRMIKYLQHAPQGGTGGRPNQKGVGPAQDVKRQIDELRITEPNITWKELFERIPNQYSNYRSMQTSMYILRERIYQRDNKG